MHPQRRRNWPALWLMGGLMALVTATGLVSAQEATPTSDVSATPSVDPPQLSGAIIIDGSSTVWPIALDAAERFMVQAPVFVEVELSGTGGGFRRFCANESDLQNASRPITDDEAASCAANGIAHAAFPLGYDGITVTVNPQNTWVQCFTVEQLRTLWAPDSPVMTWQDLDPAWPDIEIDLYGPGPDSGTFDYFTESIVGEAGLTRTDYVPSENDLDLVEGVASQQGALGYFGFSYYEADADRLRPVAIDAGAGCVLPTLETIADGSYAPLARPLFLYVNTARLERPEVREFLLFAFSQMHDVVETVGYVPLPEPEYDENLARLTALFEG